MEVLLLLVGLGAAVPGIAVLASAGLAPVVVGLAVAAGLFCRLPSPPLSGFGSVPRR